MYGTPSDTSARISSATMSATSFNTAARLGYARSVSPGLYPRATMYEGAGIVTLNGIADPESDALEIQGITTFPLAELRGAWEGTLPALFD